MNSNLSRIIAVFCSVTLMSMTVYGGTERIDNDKESNVRLGKIDDSEINNALQPFADASHIEENIDIEVFMEVNEFNYGGKISNIETFTFRQTKYVPLRTVANFLGREVSYDASSERIDITDNNSETVSYFSEETGFPVVPKFVYTDIYYNGYKLQDISTEFTNEAKKISNTSMPIFNYNDRVYVPLKLLTEGFGLLREYDEMKVKITEPSDKLKFIPNAKTGYKAYGEIFENNGEINEELIEEALLRQWNHYSEPFEVEMEYNTLYYLGKPTIEVNVSILDYDSYLQTGAYEVTE